jgi:hypothetical protein
MGLTMFESIGLLLLWIACTYFFTQIVLGVMDAFKTVHSEVKDDLSKRLNEIIHRVKSEQVGEVIYWYDLDDGEFLAQGRTQEEIISVIKNRYPDHMFFLDSNELISQPTWTPKPLPTQSLTKNS